MIALHRLRHDRRGVAGIEFALVVSIVLLLTAGAIELGLMMIVDASLEIAIRAVSRTGSISSAGTQAERIAKIEQTVESILGGWVPRGSSLDVEQFVYPNLAAIGLPTWIENGNEPGCQAEEGDCTGVQLFPGIGLAGDLVLYRVTLNRPGFSGVLRLIGISDLTFSRQTVVLNE